MSIFDPYTYDLRSTATLPGATEAALADDPLLEVPREARQMLWHGLTQAVESALDLWERTPPGRRSTTFSPVQHAGKRRFAPEMLRAQTLSGWHRLVGIELRMAVEALEALVQDETSARARAQLAEQCARVGQLYGELKHRAGEEIARAILRWELRVLRYWNSPVLAPLLWPNPPKLP